MTKLNIVNKNAPWYSKGLSFKCTGCGNCCTGAPGAVWVELEEVERMADFLNLSLEDFSKQYLRSINGRLSLIEDAKTYDCCFLKDKKCTLYTARPTQCRTFPWWPHLLESEENWKEAAKDCEGICPNAPIVPIEVINEQLHIQQAYQANAHQNG